MKKNPYRGGSAAREIIRILEKAQASGNRSSQIFEDWTSLAAACLHALPHHFRAALEGRVYEDTPETQALFERLRVRYDRRYFDLFAEAQAILLSTPDDGYADTIGEVYMEIGWPSAGR